MYDKMNKPKDLLKSNKVTYMYYTYLYHIVTWIAC